MRVLHVANARLFGGIEQLLSTLAGSAGLLRRARFEFAVCAEGRLYRELHERGAVVHLLGDVRLRRPASVWSARRRFRALLSGGVDIVVCHAPWAHAIFGGVARSEGAKVVFWQHDHATGRGLVERAAGRIRADLVVCNSRWTATSSRLIQPGAPSRTLYYPVPAPPPGTRARRDRLRSEFQTRDDEVAIVSAARLEPYKGHLALIEALGHLRDLAWRLWIAGRPQRPHESAYLERIKGAAEAAGIADRVRFIGERTDMPAVFAAADVMAQANTGPEPFGLVFAEALYAGLPVVTAAMGGAPEVVDDTCGRLVPAGDSGALVDALRQVIGDHLLRATLGARGPVRAAERCDPAVTLPLIEEALLGVTGGAVV